MDIFEGYGANQEKAFGDAFKLTEVFSSLERLKDYGINYEQGYRI